MKKLFSLLLAALLLFGCFGCGQEDVQPTLADQTQLTGPLIGICLPEETAVWQENAFFLQAELNALGYPVEVAYGENDPATQAQQMASFVEKQVAALVVAPVDSMALAEGLQAAETAGIPVVSFDRHLMGTETVDAFVTFDHEDVGRQVGDYIVKTMDLETAQEEEITYTIEFLMGSADDDTALRFHAGLMGVLQPYLDAGVLKSLSGRTSFADTYITFADPHTAAEKLTGFLESFYKKDNLDILCLADDAMVAGCRKILSQYRWEEPVLITGLGGSLAGVKQVAEGQQNATVYKDYPALAKTCAGVVNALIVGEELAYEKMVDNQIKDVPAFLERAFLVTADNYEEKIVDAGIYPKIK